MPYESDAQRRYFHANEGKKKGLTKKVVDEYDRESKGMDLPERKKKADPRHPQLPANRKRS